jgi:hypothetical protein
MRYVWHGGDVDVELAGGDALITMENERAGMEISCQIPYGEALILSRRLLAVLAVMEVAMNVAA